MDALKVMKTVHQANKMKDAVVSKASGTMDNIKKPRAKSGAEKKEPKKTKTQTDLENARATKKRAKSDGTKDSAIMEEKEVAKKEQPKR